MCFGDWSRQDFISNAELMEMLRDKGKAREGDDNSDADDDDWESDIFVDV